VAIRAKPAFAQCYGGQARSGGLWSAVDLKVDGWEAVLSAVRRPPLIDALVDLCAG
jgi:hypothetical protein